MEIGGLLFFGPFGMAAPNTESMATCRQYLPLPWIQWTVFAETHHYHLVWIHSGHVMCSWGDLDSSFTSNCYPNQHGTGSSDTESMATFK
jgi:hypothetical protein